MNIATILYLLFIRPLELLFEVIFALANRYLNNPVLCIVVLSLVVNFLVLPLYKRADALQAEERAKEKSLEKWVGHIKKTFTGDERFLMLQYYYKQNDYKPIYALKSSVSLLLQIPFFIAAYRFLSGVALLRGLAFGPIADLSQPDALFHIGTFAVNVLPIAMTLINIISGTVYSKGLPVKQKVQLYGVALVFLVLLYTSPSGLVFYWLLNNLFSLLKNIVFKLYEAGKGPKISIPLPKFEGVSLQTTNLIFAFAALFLAVLTGAFIPSNVIVASTQEFLDIMNLQNPVQYVWYTVFMALGTFVVWFGVYYLLADRDVKVLFSMGMWVLCGVAVLDYMGFGRNLGLINSFLQYETTPAFSAKIKVFNLGLVLLVAPVLCFVYQKKQRLVQYGTTVLFLAVTVISVMHMSQMTGTYREVVKTQDADSLYAEIPLSRTGQNVIVLMMDRATTLQLPYIFQEKPQLYEQFDGFTYYPNTLSYGSVTSVGAPGLYGGYEYIPSEMNKRTGERMVDKHDEALKVMPKIFLDEGYEVTVCDPTYAGYGWIPDLTIYDEYPEIHKYYTNAVFNYDNTLTKKRTKNVRHRNFFCFSVTKIAPVALQGVLYNAGMYNELIKPEEVFSSQIITGPSTATGLFEAFMNAYTALEALPEITRIEDEDDEENTFLMMSNDTTHEPVMLQTPDYVPAENVDNTEYDAAMQGKRVIDGVEIPLATEEQIIHYHANMATYLKLGEWFDYLRQQGVYDNTRIIIASDHGRGLGQFPYNLENGESSETYRALLLVKDFNATGFTTDDTFMTNADVPTLAFQDTVEHPVNPFTKKEINSDAKSEEMQISGPTEWEVSEGNTTREGEWISFSGTDSFDMSQWKILGNY